MLFGNLHQHDIIYAYQQHNLNILFVDFDFDYAGMYDMQVAQEAKHISDMLEKYPNYRHD